MTAPAEKLKVYSPEEIDMFLNGTEREVDRLLLHSVNNIAAAVAPHILREDNLFKAMGDIEAIRTRSAWIDTQIRKQEKWNRMMDRVIESTTVWALPMFGLILFIWFGDHILEAARHILAKKL